MSTAAGRLLLDSRKIFPDVVVLRLRPPYAQTLSWYSASVSLGGACWGRGLQAVPAWVKGCRQSLEHLVIPAAPHPCLQHLIPASSSAEEAPRGLVELEGLCV